MSISNCSAYSASATAQPITGIVRAKPGPSEVPVVQPVAAIKAVAGNDQREEKGPPPEASLSSDTLAALLAAL